MKLWVQGRDSDLPAASGIRERGLAQSRVSSFGSPLIRVMGLGPGVTVRLQVLSLRTGSNRVRYHCGVLTLQRKET